jgi:hypothetical protein
MIGFALALHLVLAGGKQPQEAAPPPYDVARVRAELQFLGDGRGHYLVLVPFASADQEKFVFWGSGPDFYRLHERGYMANAAEKRFGFAYWEPRVRAISLATVEYAAEKYTVRCDDRTAQLVPLSAAERRAMLDRARFWDGRFTRAPYALARDDRGTYYYVDHAELKGEAAGDFRLYAGPRGALRRMKMTNIVNDSQGDIFATPDGTLRLVLNRGESIWIRGQKRTPLSLLPIGDNLVLVYAELGVYRGQRLGTPCDDL